VIYEVCLRLVHSDFAIWSIRGDVFRKGDQLDNVHSLYSVFWAYGVIYLFIILTNVICWQPLSIFFF
jgi:hypothetical protein